MTVEVVEVKLAGQVYVECNWFDGGQRNIGRFAPESLVSAEPEAPND